MTQHPYDPNQPAGQPQPGGYDPATGQPYPAQPYPAQAAYPAQPGYPPGYAQPGYPAYGYPAPIAPRPKRPGTAVAIAVLQFVQAAFVLSAGVTLISAGGFARDFGTAGTEATLLGVLDLAIGGLLIAGGVTVLKPTTPISMLACLSSLAMSAYWAIRFIPEMSSAPGATGTFIGFLIWYSVLPIICLALVPSVTKWMREGSAMVPGQI